MSLLLDALKQAEKSKKEQATDGVEQDKETLKLDMEDLARAGKAPPGYGGGVSGELSIEPLDTDAGAQPPADTDQMQVSTGNFSGELRLSPEESQSLSMDLEKFAQELSETTDNFPPPGFEETGQTNAQSVVGEGSVTMPSMKNVQRSLNDFYGEPTGVMSNPEPAPPDEAPPTKPHAATEDTGSSTQPSQHAAQNVFAAKSGGDSRSTLWLSLAAVVLALLLGGAYLWFSVFDVDPITPPTAQKPLPRVAPPRPTEEQLAAAALAEAGKANTGFGSIDSDIEDAETVARELALATQTQAPQTQESMQPENITPPAEMTAVAEMTQLVPEPAEATVAAAAAAAAAPEPAVTAQPAVAPVMEPVVAKSSFGPPAARGAEKMAPIQIKRGVRRDRQHAALQQAYDDFNAGDISAAQNAYRQVLRVKPNNRDALMGMAAVALQEGRGDEARGYYQQLLYQNPQDQTAQAALTTLQGAVDPVASESRIKILLDQRPNTPYLYFALGNLYAQQARWAEAQAAYFNAWNGEPDNGDYLFNLAIALDHLNQRDTALKFYQQAVEAANVRTVHFDPTQVYQRIYELKESQAATNAADEFSSGAGF